MPIKLSHNIRSIKIHPIHNNNNARDDKDNNSSNSYEETDPFTHNLNFKAWHWLQVKKVCLPRKGFYKAQLNFYRFWNIHKWMVPGV